MEVRAADVDLVDRPALAVRRAVGNVLESQQDLLPGVLSEAHALVDPRWRLATAADAGVSRAVRCLHRVLRGRVIAAQRTPRLAVVRGCGHVPPVKPPL